MLTKILFTALIVAVVYAIYRFRARTAQPVTPARSVRTPAQKSPASGSSRIGRIAAYSFVALIILISSGFFYLNWRGQHEVVRLRVLDGRSGNATTYQTYKKYIGDGRISRFKSLDGKTVILGEADRVEIMDGD